MFDQSIAAEVLGLRLITRPICLPHVSIAAFHPHLDCFDAISDVGAHIIDGFRKRVRQLPPKLIESRGNIFIVASGLALQRERVSCST